MSTRGHRAPDQLHAPGYAADAAVEEGESEHAVPRRQQGAEHLFEGGGPPRGSGRRRRHRSHKGKQRGPSSQGGGPHVEVVSRERMFQDIEGLLRQIRECAEESPVWSADQLNDFTQTVTGFTKSLEQEGEQISQRVRSEYQRIREKLSQALRSWTAPPASGSGTLRQIGGGNQIALVGLDGPPDAARQLVGLPALLREKVRRVDRKPWRVLSLCGGELLEQATGDHEDRGVGFRQRVNQD
jgi:hypothetical protein